MLVKNKLGTAEYKKEELLMIKKFMVLILVLAMTIIVAATPACADVVLNDNANLSNGEIVYTYNGNAYVPVGTYYTPNYLSYDDCHGWQKGEIKNLRPGFICIGDVYVWNVKKFDGGDKEDTVVINLSYTYPTIRAEYGAGEEAIVIDVNSSNFSLNELKQQLANQEFSLKDDNDEYLYTKIRFVVIDEYGNILRDDYWKNPNK